MLRHGLSVKFWLQKPPSVEAARPARCPHCDAGARASDRGLQLRGHGRCERMVARGLRQGWDVLLLRRYRCVCCGRTCTVGPQELVARRLYRRDLIAVALVAWVHGQGGAGTVRAVHATWQVLIESQPRDWPMLRRWVRAAPAVFGARCPCSDLPPRSTAERVVQWLLSHQPPGSHALSLSVQASCAACALPL